MDQTLLLALFGLVVLSTIVAAVVAVRGVLEARRPEEPEPEPELELELELEPEPEPEPEPVRPVPPPEQAKPAPVAKPKRRKAPAPVRASSGLPKSRTSAGPGRVGRLSGRRRDEPPLAGDGGSRKSAAAARLVLPEPRPAEPRLSVRPQDSETLPLARVVPPHRTGPASARRPEPVVARRQVRPRGLRALLDSLLDPADAPPPLDRLAARPPARPREVLSER